jgi:hypothetical protein
VRYVLVERRAGRAGPGTEASAPPGATVLADTANALVLDLGSGTAPEPVPTPLAGGWVVSGLTWLAGLVVLGHAGSARFTGRGSGRGYRLVQSRP